jgi:hypothetical protein
VSATCWHSKCVLGDHGMDDRIHETESGETFRAPLAEPAPVDWPARFRAAGEVTKGVYPGALLLALAKALEECPDDVEAIGSALLGRDR